MLPVRSQACPMMYECPKLHMVPMIRSLRRCAAEEARESICSNCTERPQIQETANTAA